jgi:hypothetical protein
MKKIVFFVSGLLVSFVLTAQKQINDANVVKRDVKGFHAIRVSHGIEVLLSEGNEEAVAVSANDPKVRDKIVTEVINGELRIYVEHDFWNEWRNLSRRKLRAYVSFVKLDGVRASSGSSIKVDGTIKATKLNIETSSGASLDGKVEVGEMSVDQSSGSVIKISGTVSGKLLADGSSGSVFHGYDLAVENCEADLSSGAGVQVTVNKELSVEASSGGYVKYRGNGLIRNIRTSSGGSVSRKD